MSKTRKKNDPKFTKTIQILYF